MLGYLDIYDKENNLIGNCRYSTVSNVGRRRLFQLQEYKGAKFYCGCTDSALIEMRISRDLKIYPSQNGLGLQHHDKCPRHIGADDVALWTFENVPNSRIYYNVAAPYATAKDFAVKLNRLTYERLSAPVFRLPDTIQEFNRKVYTTQKYIKTANGQTLIDMNINRSIANLEVNKEYFFYGVLKAVSPTEFNPKLLYADCINTQGKRYRFYINTDVFYEFFNGSPNLVWCIAGFLIKKSDNVKMLSFTDFFIEKIDAMGVMCR